MEPSVNRPKPTLHDVEIGRAIYDLAASGVLSVVEARELARIIAEDTGDAVELRRGAIVLAEADPSPAAVKRAIERHNTFTS